ncbi:MAG: glycosyltransferase [Candidatus Aminicenantes bacterium]|nr:glycosyltransferase [Candidatus Aminicenantes bacterium]
MGKPRCFDPLCGPFCGHPSGGFGQAFRPFFGVFEFLSEEKGMTEYDIFVISDDVAGEKMAGPGIRAWELAKCLAKSFEVILAVPDYSYKSSKNKELESCDFEVIDYSLSQADRIEDVGKKSRILIMQGYVLSKFPEIKSLSAHLICDLYVPFPLETLFIHQKKIPSIKDREYMYLKDLNVYKDQLRHGDHFLCANIRQRDLFAGSLLCLNRINPRYLDHSTVLDQLISVVPFGISPDEPGENRENTRDVLQKKFPGIQKDSVVFLWGGVISNWFDPLTLIKAVQKAAAQNPKIKLLFLSTQHANPLLPKLDMAQQAMELSDQLGLTDETVFFNHEWVDYSKRKDYFRAADAGVSIHINHFETYYSFRTRILDYLKYELPIICTQGDMFSELAAEKNLGLTVGSEDEEELTRALVTLAEDAEKRQHMRERIQTEKKHFFWDRVSEPLVLYCQRVLSGQEPKKTVPVKKEKTKSLKRKSRSHFRTLFHQIPMKISSKIRRIFKF